MSNSEEANDSTVAEEAKKKIYRKTAYQAILISLFGALVLTSLLLMLYFDFSSLGGSSSLYSLLGSIATGIGALALAIAGEVSDKTKKLHGLFLGVSVVGIILWIVMFFVAALLTFLLASISGA
jgi:hypothetical protein